MSVEAIQKMRAERGLKARPYRCVPSQIVFESNNDAGTILCYVYMEAADRGVQQVTDIEGWRFKEFNKPEDVRRVDLSACSPSELQAEMQKQPKIFNCDDIYKALTSRDTPMKWERCKKPTLKGVTNARKRTKNPVRKQKAKRKAKAQAETEA